MKGIRMQKKVVGILLVLLIIVNACHIFLVKNGKAEVLDENFTLVEAIEQTESMEQESFKEEEYIPVIPEGINIAPEGNADSTAFVGVYNGRKAIDENRKGVSYWEGAEGTYPNELSVSFAEPRNIHAIKVCLNPESIWGKRIQTFSVSYLDAEGAKQELFAENHYTFDPKKGNEVVLEFEEVEVTSVILTFTDNTGATGGQVAELEIYSKQ